MKSPNDAASREAMPSRSAVLKRAKQIAYRYEYFGAAKIDCLLMRRLYENPVALNALLELAKKKPQRPIAHYTFGVVVEEVMHCTARAHLTEAQKKTKEDIFSSAKEVSKLARQLANKIQANASLHMKTPAQVFDPKFVEAMRTSQPSGAKMLFHYKPMRVFVESLKQFADSAEQTASSDPVIANPRSKLAAERLYALALCALFQNLFGRPFLSIVLELTNVVFDHSGGDGGVSMGTIKSWWSRNKDAFRTQEPDEMQPFRFMR